MADSDLKVMVGDERPRSETVATRIIRTSRIFHIQSVCVIILFMLIATASSLLLIITRPTHVEDGALVDTAGVPVATGTSFIEANFTDIVEEVDSVGPTALDQLTEGRLSFTANAAYSLTITGYRYYNNSAFDLFASGGLRLTIDRVDGRILAKLTDVYPGAPPAQYFTISGETTKKTKQSGRLLGTPAWNFNGASSHVKAWKNYRRTMLRKKLGYRFE